LSASERAPSGAPEDGGQDRPLIGITTYARDEGGRFHLPGHYVDCVRRAGGAAVLLPPGETEFQSILRALDGVILAGGGDLAPELYGGRHHETIYSVDPERDQYEIDLAVRLVRAGLPTLGICRGMQVLNVALGGTLIEHLPDAVGEAVLHRLPPRVPTTHAVTLERGSKLADILGTAECVPSSWHHQAVREPARGLAVVARAPDGAIEAVEMPSHPWLFGVQWHPELTAAADGVQQRLFDALVEAARARQRTRTGYSASSKGHST
jgi:putative glutamine amidotransferase